MYLLLFFGSLLLTSGYAILNEDVVKATNDFSIDLLKTIFSSGNEATNTILSPISVYDVLAILQQGAGGNSLAELTKVLEAAPSLSREGYSNLTRSLKRTRQQTEVEFANKLFASDEYNVRPQFRDITVQDFLSDIQSVDYKQAQEAADIINTWVSDSTNQRIQNMISPDMITADTVLMIFNAIFFSGSWKFPFKSTRTDLQDFTALDGTISSVSTMHLQEDLNAQHNPDIAATLVHLPFSGSEFSMVVVVPDEVDGLNKVLDGLQQQQLSSIFGRAELRHVDLSLPKFKFDTTSLLVPTLQKMGLQDIFTPSANLAGIGDGPLYVSNILQKATVEVDENGATAAAATGAMIEFTSLITVPNKEVLQIKANRPFLFFIAENNNSVLLFSGWVAAPSD